MLTDNDLAVGGQAVIEGVMMRAENVIATAVRNPQQEIVIDIKPFTPLVKRYRMLDLPIIRGFLSLIEIMYIGTATLMYSAEVALGEQQEEKTKISTLELITTVGTSILFSIVLFVVIPAGFFAFLKSRISSTIMLNIIEGMVRFSIFLGFILFTRLFADMRRVYEYHGAEHKVIHAYEAGEPLEVENIRKHTTIHPRCGTSFLLIVIIFSIVIYTFLGQPDILHRIVYKLMLLPVISGIAYEVIRLTKKVKSPLLRFVLLPGMLMQRLTTREPDDKQIEVAIEALRSVV